MSFFPSYINLKDRKILLIGGGDIALEKLEKLVEFTKEIKIIALGLSPDFLKFADKHHIPIEQRSYVKGDILGFDIVVVATNTIDLHREIYEESRKSRILVNSVDNTKYCDFIFPSYIKKGDLIVSVSTSGASPAMAKRLRIYIERLLPHNIANFLEEMKSLRKTMPKGRERMRFFEEKSDWFMRKYLS